MSHATPSEAEVADTLTHLTLSPRNAQKTKAKPKSASVADSWADELSSGSDTETESLSRTTTSNSNKDNLSPINTSMSKDLPNPPPPTPASPTPFEFPDNVPFAQRSREGSRRGSAAASPAKRPEKTTAVAGRLIAGALGVRAPKRTEEEREYDKAMREKEKKRRDEERNREKAETLAAEARKRAVWED